MLEEEALNGPFIEPGLHTVLDLGGEHRTKTEVWTKSSFAKV